MKIPNAGGMVLALLEDDGVIRLTATLLLEAKGVHVIAASSGTDLARRIVASGNRPAVVANYRLGSRTAVDDLPEVMAVAAGARVVIATGDSSRETRERIEAYGWRLLIKPYRPEDLLLSIGHGVEDPA